MKTNKLFTTLAIGVLSLTACGGSNSKEPEEIGSPNYNFTTDLEEVKEELANTNEEKNETLEAKDIKEGANDGE